MVLEISSKLLILAGINQISDSLNVVGTGVLRGQGRQRIDPFSTLYRITSLAIPLDTCLHLNLVWR